MLVHLSERASIPGKILPSTSSRDAPPPVDTWDNFSAELGTFLSKATVSPPPITDVDPFDVAFMIESSIVSDPFENGFISKTPCGPFQKIVFEFWIIWVLSLMVSGPISNPNQLGLMPACSSVISYFEFSSKASA